LVFLKEKDMRLILRVLLVFFLGYSAAIAQDKQPIVILISLDGFRHDNYSGPPI
jgi:hypothetical protein